MALLDILHYPDPRLRASARPVETIDDGIRRIVDDMFETMYAAPGIGLAAIQVNIRKRIVTIDISEGRDQPLCLINPEIIEVGESRCESKEGCLSVPDLFEKVSRPDRIRVRCLDQDGQSREFEAQDLLAVCIQHEIDHLDGKLFIDRLSRLKRGRIRKRMEKELALGPKKDAAVEHRGHRIDDERGLVRPLASGLWATGRKVEKELPPSITNARAAKRRESLLAEVEE